MRFFSLQWIQGVRDALYIPHLGTVLLTSSLVRRAILDAFVYSALAFLSIWSFQIFFEPTISALLMEGDSWLPRLPYYFLVAIYYLLWILPMFILSFVINSKWLNIVAQNSFVALCGSPPKTSSIGLNDLARMFAAELYTSTFYSMFVIQCSVMAMLPVLGPILNFILLCWLYSLYCFEYKWIGWHIGRRLRHVEDNWAYFVGFGMVTGTPFTVASIYGGFWLSYTIWWLFFPYFVVMAIGAPQPTSLVSSEPGAANRIALFRFARWLNMKILNGAAFIFRTITQEPTTSSKKL